MTTVIANLVGNCFKTERSRFENIKEKHSSLYTESI